MSQGSVHGPWTLPWDISSSGWTKENAGSRSYGLKTSETDAVANYMLSSMLHYGFAYLAGTNANANAAGRADVVLVTYRQW